MLNGKRGAGDIILAAVHDASIGNAPERWEAHCFCLGLPFMCKATRSTAPQLVLKQLSWLTQ